MLQNLEYQKKRIQEIFAKIFKKKNIRIEIIVILGKKKLFINVKQIEEKLKLSITQIKLYLSEIYKNYRINSYYIH